MKVTFFLFALLVFREAFAEDYLHEFSPQVSLYTGDALRSSVNGAFSYAFHFNSSMWLGLDFVGGTAKVDQPNGLSLNSGERYIGCNGVFYYNIPGLIGEPQGLGADLYTSIGMGHFWIGSHKEFFGFLGGGMLLHTGLKWLMIRFDLKGAFYRLRNANGSNFNSDLALNMGPSFIY